MKERIPLKPNTKLIFKNQAGGSMPFLSVPWWGRGDPVLYMTDIMRTMQGEKARSVSKSVTPICFRWKETARED